MDALRFGAIFKVLAIGGTALIGLLSWSLKTQYDTMSTQVQSAQTQLQAIQDLKAQVGVPKQADQR